MKDKRSEQTKGILFGILAFLVVFFTTIKVQATDMSTGKWWNLPKPSAALSITSDERQALNDLYAQNHDATSGLNGTLKKEHLKLEVILEGDPVDETALNSQFIQVEAVKQNLDNAHLKYVLGVRNILGPDRFKQLSLKLQGMGKKRHAKSGHRNRRKMGNQESSGM